jgi:hypothetical protein
MATKGFKDAANAQPVYSTIIGAAQDVQKAEEEQKALDAQEALSTRGLKGVKLPRINMAFTPSNLDFIRIMAAIRGQSMTQYVNSIIERERLENGDAYQKAKALTEESSH